MASAVGSVISGVLGSTGSSGEKGMAQALQPATNGNVSVPGKQPEIKNAEVKDVAKPVENKVEQPRKEQNSSNWQDLAKMASGLLTSQSSAPLVNNSGSSGLSQSVAK